MRHETVCRIALAVVDEHTLDALDMGNPRRQTVHIRVTRNAGEHLDLRRDLHGLTEQLDRACALDQGASQRAVCLIAHEQDGVLRLPEVMLEVVLDSARLAHARRRDDDLASLVKIDRTGFLRRHDELQILERDRVDAHLDKAECFFIIAAVLIMHEHARRFDRRR